MSYSLIPPEDAGPASGEDTRVEPRLTVLPMERKVRSAEIAAPSQEDAAFHGARFEATPIDPLPPNSRTRRRRLPGIAILGLAAVLIAFGVLAATFSKVVTGGNIAATAPATDAPPTVALAPPPPATEETAGPGVRIIPQAGEAAAAAASEAAPAAAGETATATTIAASPQAPALSPAPVDPPLPRLRPTMPTAVAALPTPAAPAAIAPAPAQDADVNALMSDVDRILARQRAAAPQPAPLPPAADAGFPVAAGPAPLEVVPPPPTRRGWFLYPSTRDASGMPIPPADIPDPEGQSGQ